jgi:hypothetical protein
MSWKRGAAVPVDLGASSMIPTTNRGLSAGNMPTKVIQYRESL